jgi:hypothetical protein
MSHNNIYCIVNVEFNTMRVRGAALNIWWFSWLRVSMVNFLVLCVISIVLFLFYKESICAFLFCKGLKPTQGRSQRHKNCRISRSIGHHSTFFRQIGCPNWKTYQCIWRSEETKQILGFPPFLTWVAWRKWYPFLICTKILWFPR